MPKCGARAFFSPAVLCPLFPILVSWHTNPDKSCQVLFIHRELNTKKQKKKLNTLTRNAEQKKARVAQLWASLVDANGKKQKTGEKSWFTRFVCIFLCVRANFEQRNRFTEVHEIYEMMDLFTLQLWHGRLQMISTQAPLQIVARWFRASTWTHQVYQCARELHMKWPQCFRISRSRATLEGEEKKVCPKKTQLFWKNFSFSKTLFDGCQFVGEQFCWYLSPSTRRSHLDSIIIPRYRLCFDNFMLPTVAIEAHLKFHHFIKFPGIWI